MTEPPVLPPAEEPSAADHLGDLPDRARALRRAGRSTSQIAQELGVPHNGTLAKWLRGVPPPEWTRRPRAKDELRQQARQLRAAGISIPEIARRLEVSKSTCSLWLGDLPRIDDAERLRRLRRSVEWPNVARHRERRHRRAVTKLEATREIGRLSDRELFLVGVALYWAEGQKDKPWLAQRRERMSFVNSDPHVIQVFSAWLDLLGVDRSDRSYRVSIHESADIAAAEGFWSELVGIPREALRKTALKRHNPRTNRLNTGDAYRGCLSVNVRRSAELYQRVEGWWFGIVEVAGDTMPA